MAKDSLAQIAPADTAIGRPTATARRLVDASVSANTRRAYAGALGQLDAWLDGRRLDDAALAAYLAELHDAGRAASSAATVVAAARFRARLAGQADPAGARTARVLVGDRGRGQAYPFSAAADQAAVARGRLDGMIAGLLFMGGNGDRKSPPDIGRIWTTAVTACWSLSAAARRTRTARRTTHGSCRTASRERPARCGPPQDRMLRSEPLAQQLDSFIVGATYRRINVGQIRTFLWLLASGRRTTSCHGLS